MIPLHAPIILGLILFSIGILAFVVRRSIIGVFLAIELMLNSVNLIWVSFAKWYGQMDGQVMVIFVMAVAAAEAAIGLGIMLFYLRQSRHKSVMVDDLT